MPHNFPGRGEIWEVTLVVATSLEDGPRTQNAVVVSDDGFNNNGRIVVVLWVTSSRYAIPSHLELTPQQSGLSDTCFVQCDEIQTISRARLISHEGTVDAAKMREIEEIVRAILLPNYRRRKLPWA